MADYLDIHVSPDIWPRLVEAAGFEAMRRDGATLMGPLTPCFKAAATASFTGAQTNGGVASSARKDLALYDAKVEALFSPACARWVAQGRLEAGDPRLALD